MGRDFFIAANKYSCGLGKRKRKLNLRKIHLFRTGLRGKRRGRKDSVERDKWVMELEKKANDLMMRITKTKRSATNRFKTELLSEEDPPGRMKIKYHIRRPI